MYVHIGGEYQIPARAILSILDLEQRGMLEPESVNQQFLQAAEARDEIEWVEVTVPRSLVITLERVYYSPLAAATLRKRLQALTGK